MKFEKNAENLVKKISAKKKEPRWMLNYRLNALQVFFSKKTPTWGPDLKGLKYNEIEYYVDRLDSIDKGVEKKWSVLPKDVRQQYQENIDFSSKSDDLSLALEAQYDSVAIYRKILEKYEKLGVIYIDTDAALKQYPMLFKKFFGKLIAPCDNKFAALNGAFWSGGSFIYIPKNLKLDLLLHTFFRINTPNLGQFERTIIVADEGSSANYLEGCSARRSSENALHAGVVEVFVQQKAKAKYMTFQNWGKNVFNLVTKRSLVKKQGLMEWVDINVGAKITMKYPSIYLEGNDSKGAVYSFSVSSGKQNQDVGTKIFHHGKNTSSLVISRNISKKGGISSFRGRFLIDRNAKNSKSKITCDNLVIDEKSSANTYPDIKCANSSGKINHEAKTTRIDEQKIFYLNARGIKRDEVESTILLGFAEPISSKLPPEFAVEFERMLNFKNL